MFALARVKKYVAAAIVVMATSIPVLADINSTLTLQGDAETLVYTITYAGRSVFMNGGAYSDTLTITIAAK